MLTEHFLEIEVLEAINSYDSSKSPGPDGFNFQILKTCWEVVKDDILKLLDEFHSNGKLVRGLNSSFVILIPKKEAAESLNNFCPISLIGCIYKILSKILARRLRRVLNDIILENQSAFIGDRYILDGVVIVNEAIDEAKRKGLKRVFLKVDFAKA